MTSDYFNNVIFYNVFFFFLLLFSFKDETQHKWQRYISVARINVAKAPEGFPERHYICCFSPFQLVIACFHPLAQVG